MSTTFTNASLFPESKVKRAKQCLLLIRDAAGRAAGSDDPEHMGYVIEELSQVMFERTGSDDRLFEPQRAELIVGLDKLHEELAWVDSCSQDLTMLRK